jgi:peptidoglycan-associated lipoprotein
MAGIFDAVERVRVAGNRDGGSRAEGPEVERTVRISQMTPGGPGASTGGAARGAAPLAALAGALLLATLGAACGPSYPNCDRDNDCHRGEYCVNGRCQLCRGDADCPAGQSCASGRCEPIAGYCASSSDCPAGQECRANRCVAPVQAREQTPERDPRDLTPGPSPCEVSAVYFEFDSHELTSDAREALGRVANCMRDGTINRLHLTGNCDPRGTEEYNLALGERRARAVRDYLVSLGVPRNTLTVSSNGEEMARGTDEASWARDRNTTLERR